MPRETPSSSDDGYGSRVETPVDKVSAPFVSLKVNGFKRNLNLSLRKDINFFGLVFSGRGMSPDPAKIEATQKADPLSSVIDVRILSGMTNYMSRFIRDYADIVAPLT